MSFHFSYYDIDFCLVLQELAVLLFGDVDGELVRLDTCICVNKKQAIAQFCSDVDFYANDPFQACYFYQRYLDDPSAGYLQHFDND